MRYEDMDIKMWINLFGGGEEEKTWMVIQEACGLARGVLVWVF